MSAPLTVTSMRVEFHRRAMDNVGKTIAFVRKNAINTKSLITGIGGYGVIGIVDCGHGRFDFADKGAELAFTFEAYGQNGDVQDLIALPVARPDTTMSMLGRIGLLGAHGRVVSHVMAGPLPVRPTVLSWLHAGDGVAVVNPTLAARQFLDIPGPLAAADFGHGRELRALLQSIVRADRVVVPTPARKVA